MHDKRWIRLAILTASAALLPGLLAGCRPADSPEQQVRKVIGEMEVAVEERDARDLMEHLSDDYRDGYGQGPQDAQRYARGYFIANQAIHLLTRVEKIEFPATDEARATVLVGMAGRDANASSALDLAADLYEFEVTLLRENDEWKVGYAEWKRK